MKVSLKSTVFTLLITLAFSQWAHAVPQGPVIGTITTVIGTVTGTDQDGDGFTVAVGADLYAGYAFETGNRSVVGVELNDGTTLVLSGNTQGSLDAFSYSPAQGSGMFNASINRGGFRYESGQIAALYPPSAVHSRISTPKAVIGVRGTIIVATVRPDGTIKITIPAGAVNVTYFDEALGENVTVSVGEGEEARTIDISADGEQTSSNELPPELQLLIDEFVEVVRAESEGDAPGEVVPGSFQLESDTNTVTPSGGGGDIDLEPVSPAGTAP